MISHSIEPGTDQKQSLRLRRWMMAAGASAMVVVLFFAAHLLNLLDLRAFVTAVLLTLAFVVLFYAVFRSSLNMRFHDPSLTLPQVMASTLVILYALSQSKEGHGILALIYMVPFLFGVFRLSTRQLLGVTAFVALSYALIIGIQWGSEMDTDPFAFRRKLLNWIVLTSVLAFFSVMGGYISGLRRKISEANVGLEKAMQRIERLAARDELTGVLNRRSLVEILGKQKGRADRYGAAFSILMVDIDFFKRVNDTHGHLAGDAVLSRFANAAAASLRQSDTFGRYGGEEFLVLLDQTTLEGACIFGERMCGMARGLKFDEFDAALRMTVSVGIAQYRPPEALQGLIERADQALYRAKSGGRDRVERESSVT